jgi:polysaccharide pyruvyl transferase WcaK-like protein
LDLTPYQLHPNSRELEQPIVGIAPILHKYPRTCPGLAGGNTPTYVNYINKLANFVSWLLQNQYTVRFFIGEERDRLAIQELREIIDKNGVVYSEDHIIEESISTLDDLMFQLEKTNLVVASRFHSVLLAQLLNKPTLALSFHDKIDSLMADSQLTEYCLSIDDFDVETLKERFLAIKENQILVKNQLSKRTQQYREALDKQYDSLFGNL